MKPIVALSLVAALMLGGCAVARAPEPAPPVVRSTPAPPAGSALRELGYAVQVGAFASLENAVRFERSLNQRGIDAFYFLDGGLYKVRFGNHAGYAAARAQAEQLQAQGLIGEFFIVAPQDYASVRIRRGGQGDLREELVRTAHEFIGVPYRWGGASANDGFDCSGLTLVCYRLNGLDLPRVSASQFSAGRPVDPNRLQQGDLVFFATRGGREVSHVGLYIGGGRFIHAPRSGQSVRVEQLSNSYYQRTFVGARSYL